MVDEQQAVPVAQECSYKAHFERMQDMMRRYIEPITYVASFPADSTKHASEFEEPGPHDSSTNSERKRRRMDRAFISDIIHMMDGPEQRALSLPCKSGEGAGEEPFGYWVTQKGAEPALLRPPAYIPEASDLRTVTPLYTASCAVETDTPYRRLIDWIVEGQEMGQPVYISIAQDGAWQVGSEEKLRRRVANETINALRHKLWMVACHATGGGIPEIEGINRSTNDICVQITATRNAIYQAGKDAALTPDATQTREAELVAAIEAEIDNLKGADTWWAIGIRTRLRAALNARGGA